MKRKRHNPEQIIRKLRTAERLLNQGQPSPMSAELWSSQPLLITAGSSYMAG